MEAKRVRQEFILLLMILAYFIFLFVNAFLYPSDARLFPIVLTVPGILITTALMYKCEREVPGLLREWLPFLFGVLYYGTVLLIGFMLATVLTSLCVPYLMGYKNKLRIILFTLGLMVMIYAVFGLLLSMSFYKGLLGVL